MSDTSKFFYSNDGGAAWTGPFTREELDAEIQAGRVRDDSLLKREGEELTFPLSELSSPAAVTGAADSASAAVPPPLVEDAPAAGASAAVPPPLVEDEAAEVRNISLGMNGETSGPFTLKEVREMKARGELSDSTRYWMPGMPGWKPVSDLFGVGELVAQAGRKLSELGEQAGQKLSALSEQTSRKLSELGENPKVQKLRGLPVVQKIGARWRGLSRPWKAGIVLALCAVAAFFVLKPSAESEDEDGQAAGNYPEGEASGSESSSRSSSESLMSRMKKIDLYGASLKTDMDAALLYWDMGLMVSSLAEDTNVRSLQAKAAKGNSLAGSVLGWACLTGDLGVRVDSMAAARFFQKHRAHALSRLGLAFLYSIGEGGMPKDKHAAFQIYKEVSQKWDSDEANLSLAVCYATGSGCKRDDERAFELLLKCAEDGNNFCSYHIGLCYLNGRGVDKSKGRAIEWLRKAARGGLPEAKKRLSGMGVSW